MRREYIGKGSDLMEACECLDRADGDESASDTLENSVTNYEVSITKNGRVFMGQASTSYKKALASALQKANVGADVFAANPKRFKQEVTARRTYHCPAPVIYRDYDSDLD